MRVTCDVDFSTPASDLDFPDEPEQQQHQLDFFSFYFITYFANNQPTSSSYSRLHQSHSSSSSYQQKKKSKVKGKKVLVTHSLDVQDVSPLID